jgi:hypothetical protein
MDDGESSTCFCDCYVTSFSEKFQKLYNICIWYFFKLKRNFVDPYITGFFQEFNSCNTNAAEGICETILIDNILLNIIYERFEGDFTSDTLCTSYFSNTGKDRDNLRYICLRLCQLSLSFTSPRFLEPWYVVSISYFLANSFHGSDIFRCQGCAYSYEFLKCRGEACHSHPSFILFFLCREFSQFFFCDNAFFTYCRESFDKSEYFALRCCSRGI